MGNNLSNENLINEDNSNNSNADNNFNQPTDNADNNNDNNTTGFITITNVLVKIVNIVGIGAFFGALIQIYSFIVAYSKSLYYNIPLKFFFSNSEMVKPIIYIVCIFLIILPNLKNLKYKIIEKNLTIIRILSILENLTIIRILSILASFFILFELCTYTIGNPADISEKTAAPLLNVIKVLVAIVIVCSYAKQYYETLKKESKEVRNTYILAPSVLILLSIIGSFNDKILYFQSIPIIAMSFLVVFHCAVKHKKIKLIPLVITILSGIFFILLLFYLNDIMTTIAYRSDYEVIEISTEENTEKSTKENTIVIITEYNDSFIVMYGNIKDSELTIYDKFDFVDKNELNGHISHHKFKKVYIKDK